MIERQLDTFFHDSKKSSSFVSNLCSTIVRTSSVWTSRRDGFLPVWEIWDGQLLQAGYSGIILIQLGNWWSKQRWVQLCKSHFWQPRLSLLGWVDQLSGYCDIEADLLLKKFKKTVLLLPTTVISLWRFAGFSIDYSLTRVPGNYFSGFMFCLKAE